VHLVFISGGIGLGCITDTVLGSVKHALPFAREDAEQIRTDSSELGSTFHRCRACAIGRGNAAAH
jgi:hypothetical protein